MTTRLCCRMPHTHAPLAAADHKHRTHLCSDIEPVATAHSSINAESNVVGDIMLPHLNDGIQRVLQAET